eukprot:86650-Chlamydomonas_euryale.AAC.2
MQLGEVRLPWPSKPCTIKPDACNLSALNALHSKALYLSPRRPQSPAQQSPMLVTSMPSNPCTINPYACKLNALKALHSKAQSLEPQSLQSPTQQSPMLVTSKPSKPYTINPL